MHDQITAQDLKDRLVLIEAMIAEGRRTTGSWGWTFALWGAAFYVAIAWAAWGHTAWAWPATMIAAVVVTVILASLQAGRGPGTMAGRAVGSLWLAFGISMFLLFVPLGLAGRLTDPHLFIAVVSGMLGMANATSALILRWRVQLGCAVVWWAAAVAACFGTQKQATAAFLAAIFVCQIAFGVYGMIREGREKPRQGRADA
ncbi:MAG TPA: hypothetical protein VMT20_30245 [Terriglobia bacterium]|nr:hypothetical protein [Terriglobia bacterium]